MRTDDDDDDDGDDGDVLCSVGVWTRLADDEHYTISDMTTIFAKSLDEFRFTVLIIREQPGCNISIREMHHCAITRP